MPWPACSTLSDTAAPSIFSNFSGTERLQTGPLWPSMLLVTSSPPLVFNHTISTFHASFLGPVLGPVIHCFVTTLTSLIPLVLFLTAFHNFNMTTIHISHWNLTSFDGTQFKQLTKHTPFTNLAFPPRCVDFELVSWWQPATSNYSPQQTSSCRQHSSQFAFSVEVIVYTCDNSLDSFDVFFTKCRLKHLLATATHQKSSKKIENLCFSLDLIDIWRIRRFSWRQKTPMIQRRLDYWLISNNIQEEVDKVDIIPAIRSDHSAITLYINDIENSTYGPSFWKFNARLSEDKDYVDLIRNKIGEWVDKSREIEDPRVTWDYLRYKIRYETIGYSKKKAKERRSEMVNLESRLRVKISEYKRRFELILSSLSSE